MNMPFTHSHTNQTDQTEDDIELARDRTVKTHRVFSGEPGRKETCQ